MGETLTIQNFGPIKDMTLDLRQVNVLIGDQGTGKSTVAKVLAAVKGLVRDAFWDHDRWIDSLENRQLTMKALMNRWKEKFAKWLELTGLTNSLNENSYISFEDKIYSFLYDAGKVNVTVSDIGHSTDETWVDTYIPAYREVAIVLKDKLFAVLQAKATLPDLLTRFGTAFLEARTRRPLYDYEQVFRVKYRHSNSNDYILLHDGKEILIEDASSAIRNGVPMLVVFDDTLNGPNNTYCPYLIIEEPELNCFPETQEKLVRYFIEHIKKEEGYSNRLFITTHSPYILTSLNNLMQAHQTGKREPEKADVIIPKEYWLSPDDVSAYLLLPNGTWKDIMNREEHLIEAEEIDSVSRKLNKEFDDLLTLEIRAEI